MWKKTDNGLIQITDKSRHKFKTIISKSILKELESIASEHDTHIGYLLETGFKNILKEDMIVFDKKKRPKDRIDFRTTCDKEVFNKIKALAKANKLCTNDIIELSTNYIDVDNVKKRRHRHRIE